jgi:hypothetical protein
MVLLTNCGGKSEADVDEWKEMDDFHLVMAEVYHPLKDSGDLAPIKSRAEELASAAETWANSEVPDKVDNNEVKGMLEKLKGGTSDLALQIANGAPDEDVSAQLTGLHELFHHLQEKWYEDGDDHDAAH